MGTRSLLASAANTLLRPLGAKVTGLGNGASFDRFTMSGVLRNAKKAGLAVETVVDVGAASGTPSLYESFPDARVILVEPLRENEATLAQLVKRLPNAQYVIAAATDAGGGVTINVHPDLHGSSLLLEGEDTDVNGVPRTVPGRTLDEICETSECRAPYVVKIDVQGAELQVLRGAEAVLEATGFVILEVVLFDFFEGGPRFAEIVAFMADCGFVVYDVMDPGYRPLDGAMSQIDIGFARADGVLRQQHCYATQKQRAEQIAALPRSRRSRD